jgi:hypothetical protein
MLWFAMMCLQLHTNEITMFGRRPTIDSPPHDHKGDLIDLSKERPGDTIDKHKSNYNKCLLTNLKLAAVYLP